MTQRGTEVERESERVRVQPAQVAYFQLIFFFLER